MLKFILRLADYLTRPADVAFDEADLLQHPDLSRMSERELADLPLTPAPGVTRCPA